MHSDSAPSHTQIMHGKSPVQQWQVLLLLAWSLNLVVPFASDFLAINSLLVVSPIRSIMPAVSCRKAQSVTQWYCCVSQTTD